MLKVTHTLARFLRQGVAENSWRNSSFARLFIIIYDKGVQIAQVYVFTAASVTITPVCDGGFSSGLNAVRWYLCPGKRKGSVLWERLVGVV